ncbi:alpha/beta hydrolase-fold protein [Megasphaera vaginalis (ex Bordigoni et al. 2020)]|uniref:alpha/beta hydrolase-fold protein n=1 Tax=Megasphaera vaginalis (ex Bordigoni et al. 2020) TaxID=2045301 RepID=UPI0011AF61BB|nr:alpha/beta hydrolase-fold protein [Megasphaera vaginalis (ex Bordigoni et al. 2020)]
MRIKTKIYLLLCLLGAMTTCSVAAEPVVMIPNVYGDGEKIEALAIQYPFSIDHTSVAADAFQVADHQVADVYTNVEPKTGNKHEDGKYVIVDLVTKNTLSPLDKQGPKKPKKAENEKADAPLHSDRTAPVLTASVVQVKNIRGTDGTIYPASTEVMKAETATSSIIDKFIIKHYTDNETKSTISYTVFLPENYTPQQKYPLVFFIADASANINNDRTPLFQGNGATIWATAEEQRKHQAIVVAPQYSEDLVNSLGMMTTDENKWTPGLTLVTNLLKNIISTYPVDKDRIYGTGQSQGGIANIAISDRYPDLFAAQYLVACQWNTDEMNALLHKNLWILVSEGDTKAYPSMNEAVSKWRQAGGKVATSPYLWDSTADAATFAQYVADMEAKGATINYSVFKNGSHTYTWSVAYTIEGIRDWLFNQTKSGRPVSATASGKFEAKRQRQLALKKEARQYFETGKNYFNGENGAPKDAVKAWAAFTKADKQGDKKAARYLGLLSLSDRKMKARTKQAFTYFMKGAENGDITSMYYLGRCYETGTGTKQNIQLAYHWYKEAAKREDIIAAPAMAALASLYERGLGAEQNLQISEELYEKAARAGYKEAADGLQRVRASQRSQRERQ